MAILVYDGVQIIDHAVPFEVFGQFALNNVYTVSVDGEPITTYMGMQVLPNYSFADAPPPDVVVLPGGDAGEAQKNADIASWIGRTVAEADHVLTVCTGIFFLVGNELLDGKQVTTWFDRQEELRRRAPQSEVIGDRIVVADGKLVSSAGIGVDGALRVLERLHGHGWAEVVRLNMEHERVPDAHHVPRVELADMLLPGSVYGAFPWRDADLLRYEGDDDQWRMDWRFDSAAPMDSLSDRFHTSLRSTEGWDLVDTDRGEATWCSKWTIDGPDASEWQAVVRLTDRGAQFDLEMTVERRPAAAESPDASATSVWSIDFVRTLPGAQGDYIASIETNWASGRHLAIEQGAVRSFRALAAPQDSVRGWDVMLMTEYADSTAFADREAIFQEIFASPEFVRVEPARPSPEMREILFSVEMESFVAEPGDSD